MDAKKADTAKPAFASQQTSSITLKYLGSELRNGIQCMSICEKWSRETSRVCVHKQSLSTRWGTTVDGNCESRLTPIPLAFAYIAQLPAFFGVLNVDIGVEGSLEMLDLLRQAEYAQPVPDFKARC
jgi:hypothetical protein